MENNNKKKQDKLGMPYGTANGRLKKNIMFDMAKKLNLHICYHCELPIATVTEFSIEHKEPWLNSDAPAELFFDLGNIAFSHLKCNIEAGVKMPKVYSTKLEKNQAKHSRVKADPDRYRRKLDNKIRYYRESIGKNLKPLMNVNGEWK